MVLDHIHSHLLDLLNYMVSKYYKKNLKQLRDSLNSFVAQKVYVMCYVIF